MKCFSVGIVHWCTKRRNMPKSSIVFELLVRLVFLMKIHVPFEHHPSFLAETMDTVLSGALVKMKTIH